jgi:hypothetical protein
LQVTIRQEAGYDLALYGFSLSYKDRAIKPDDWWCNWHIPGGSHHPFICPQETSCDDCTTAQRVNKIQKTVEANAGRGKGHDKFLRQIVLWIDIEAPRYWWSEFDTYKIGTVAQSESTMHTLSKRDITADDFEEEPTAFSKEAFNEIRQAPYFDTHDLKVELPESYLQRRLVTLNYAVLRCILEQRKNHRLPEWSFFIKEIQDQVEHPGLLK